MIDASLVKNSRRVVWVYDGCCIDGGAMVGIRYHRLIDDPWTHSTGLKDFDSPLHKQNKYEH
jgi:hypothetical protein